MSDSSHSTSLSDSSSALNLDEESLSKLSSLLDSSNSTSTATHSADDLNFESSEGDSHSAHHHSLEGLNYDLHSVNLPGQSDESQHHSNIEFSNTDLPAAPEGEGGTGEGTTQGNGDGDAMISESLPPSLSADDADLKGLESLQSPVSSSIQSSSSSASSSLPIASASSGRLLSPPSLHAPHSSSSSSLSSSSSVSGSHSPTPSLTSPAALPRPDSVSLDDDYSLSRHLSSPKPSSVFSSSSSSSSSAALDDSFSSSLKRKRTNSLDSKKKMKEKSKSKTAADYDRDYDSEEGSDEDDEDDDEAEDVQLKSKTKKAKKDEDGDAESSASENDSDNEPQLDEAIELDQQFEGQKKRKQPKPQVDSENEEDDDDEDEDDDEDDDEAEAEDEDIGLGDLPQLSREDHDSDAFDSTGGGLPLGDSDYFPGTEEDLHGMIEDDDVQILSDSSSSSSASTLPTGMLAPGASASNNPNVSSQMFGGAQKAEPEWLTLGTVIDFVLNFQRLKAFVEPQDSVQLHRIKAQSDPNAVCVKTLSGETVGFLRRPVSGMLSPHLDNHLIRCSSIISDITEQHMTIRISLDCPRIWRAHILHQILQSVRIAKLNFVMTPTIKKELNAAIEAANARRGVEETVYQLSGPGMKELEDDLEKFFNREIDFSKLPVYVHAPSLITHLYPYQRQGVQWLTFREESASLMLDPSNDSTKSLVKSDSGQQNSASDVKETSSVFFWEKRRDADGKVFYFNRLTQKSSPTEPQLGRGGILADDMGLGKSIQLLALILTNTRTASTLGYTPTLLVCPVSVLNNWDQQIQLHVHKGRIRYYLYHGHQRERDPNELKKFDIVITSYNTLALEYEDGSEDGRSKRKKKLEEEDPDDPEYDEASGEKKKKKKRRAISGPSPLFLIDWTRVILDEGHIIRDRKTRQCKAACALKAERRWVVTGTVLQNRLDDLYSLLVFLRVEPFDSTQVWNRFIMSPLRSKDPKGLERLQILLSAICLRRRKNEQVDGEAILKLPEKTMKIHWVNLGPKEQALYDKLAVSGKSQFRALLASDNLMRNYAFVLEMLLRMRQACNHVRLVPEQFQMKEEPPVEKKTAINFRGGKLVIKQEKVTPAPSPPPVSSSSASSSGPLSMDHIRRLVYLLEECVDMCSLCGKMMDDPMITTCGHMYCKEHLNQPLYQQTPANPLQRPSATPPPTQWQPMPSPTPASMPFTGGNQPSMPQTPTPYPPPTASPSPPPYPTPSTFPPSSFSSFSSSSASVPVPVAVAAPASIASSVPSWNGWPGACPVCGTPVPRSHLITLEMRELVKAEDNARSALSLVSTNFSTEIGAKLQTLLDDLHGSWLQDRSMKAVIFSQWTSFLDLMEKVFEYQKLKFVRLDGSMNPQQRAKSMTEFDKNPLVKLFLISLKAGGLGLNLTTANHVYLLDPWWNPAVEDQACDRVYRLGQTKPVKVVKIIAKNTVEERILELQNSKRELTNVTLARMHRSREQVQAERLQDLIALFK